MTHRTPGPFLLDPQFALAATHGADLRRAATAARLARLARAAGPAPEMPRPFWRRGRAVVRAPHLDALCCA